MAEHEHPLRSGADTRPALLLIGAGVCAALHVGKLPPALDVLRAEFGLDLAQTGLLLSMVQLAGMSAGVLVGAWVDTTGTARSLRSGLLLLALASVAGATSSTAIELLAWRAAEGLGFLLTVLAAPPWIHALANASRLQSLMGLWGTYMPLGIALGLAIGPSSMAVWGWRGWWIAVGLLTAAVALAVARYVPVRHASNRAPAGGSHRVGPNRATPNRATPNRTTANHSAPNLTPPGLQDHTSDHASSHDPNHDLSHDPTPAAPTLDGRADETGRTVAATDCGADRLRGKASSDATANLAARLKETLSHRGPWLIALCFAAYSSQWLAVIGFLPLVYGQLGLAPTTAGMLTAAVSLANAAGNMLGASLLHRGHRATRLMSMGFVAMAAGGFAAYVHVDGEPLPLVARYAAVLVFSLVGGLVPSSLFALSARMAPSNRTLGSTVGWMQQWSALGQFGGPPLAGWLAGTVGGWQFTWIVTVTLSLAGLVLAAVTSRHSRVDAAR